MNRNSRLTTFGRRLSDLASSHPHKPAIIFVPEEGEEQIISWRELDQTSNRVARWLQGYNVAGQSLVVVGLGNTPEHFYLAYAIWKLGAAILPLRARMPPAERLKILELATPDLVVADWADESFPSVTRTELATHDQFSAVPLPDVISDPGYALGSGGSTGRPKIIITPGPLTAIPGAFTTQPSLGHALGMRSGQVQLIAGPLYHNGPFLFSHLGLFEDQTIVLLERFDAGRVVDLIERHRVNFALLVPTMMRRIIKLPDVHERDFSSLDGILHTAAPCPPWLKRAWIDLIGAEKVFEGYGSSEGTGNTVIRGDEWLDHPHSVGRPTPDTEILILDPEGVPVNPGEAGEIYMRQKDVDGATYQYIGSPPARTTADGFVSVGDLGWVDAEGYLFLADRRVDLIITGGANVYPAEVEAAISEHSLIFDVAVIGLKDDEWGRRVHAIVQVVDTSDPPTIPELDTHCRERLAAYKVPKSYEFVDQLPRNAAGKIRRSALLAEREDDADRG